MCKNDREGRRFLAVRRQAMRRAEAHLRTSDTDVEGGSDVEDAGNPHSLHNVNRLQATVQRHPLPCLPCSALYIAVYKQQDSVEDFIASLIPSERRQ